MPGYLLRLTRDRLETATRLVLPATSRVLYLLEGEVTVDGASVPSNGAWHGDGPCTVVAKLGGATLLRYELVREGARTAGPPLLTSAMALDPGGAYLMRCDRVDFELGGEALPHRHKGGGIRCLVQGALELRIEGEPDRIIRPGEAWFESGREPVYARASATELTSFIRCSILPREIHGQSSIVYVNPADARSRPRTYTVFVDEPIELP